MSVFQSSSSPTTESFDASLFAQSATFYAAPTTAEDPSLRPLPRHRWTEVFGLDFAAVTMSQTLDYIDALIIRRKPSYLVTANINYAMLCSNNERLKDFTAKSNLVLCDGMPILWRSRLGKQPLPERVAGADLIFKLAERSALKGYRIFLMGGAEGVADKAAQRLKTLYPQLKIVGTECPPFREPTARNIKTEFKGSKQLAPYPARCFRSA